MQQYNIFVEGSKKEDWYFYNAIYRILLEKQLLSEQDFNVCFQPISTIQNNNASRSAVINLVKTANKLAKIKIKTNILGIIDFDNKPLSLANLYQIQRYALENYIFDPVLVFAFLINFRFDFQLDIRQHFGLYYNEAFKLASMTSEQLQHCVDFVFTQIYVNHAHLQARSLEQINIHYINGSSVKVPKWFLYHKAHELEKYFLDSFKHCKIALEKTILMQSIEQYPDFIAYDFLALFKSIQSDLKT